MNTLLLLFSLFAVSTFAQEPIECGSTNDCNPGQVCTTEYGECKPPASCKENEFCPTLCTGTCTENTNPYTVSSTLRVVQSYITVPCDSCTPLLWLHITEGLDRKLPANAEYSISVEEYDQNERVFKPVSSQSEDLKDVNGNIEAITVELPLTKSASVYPQYQYFTVQMNYQNALHLWIARIEQHASSDVQVTLSSTNPNQEEFAELLKPPAIEATTEPKTFPDVQPNSLLSSALQYLTARNIISGHPDGTFKPYDRVNRAEAAKFLLNGKYGQVSAKAEQLFPDVPLNVWFTPFVTFAYKMGIINGYPDATFKPAQTVNTAEFLKMISLTFGTELNVEHTYIDVSEDDWFNQYAGVAAKYELFPRRVQYRLYPEMLLTREEVAIAMYKLLTAQ